jgi:PAS domain-containing protein
MWSVNDRFLSKIIPRLRTEDAKSGGVWEGSWRVKGKDGSVILFSWTGRPMRRNSVLEGLRHRRFVVIQEEMREKVDRICFIASA